MQCDGSLRETQGHLESHNIAVRSSAARMTLAGRNEYGSGTVAGARWVTEVFLCPIKAPGLLNIIIGL